MLTGDKASIRQANARNNRARICKRLRRPGIDSEDSSPPAYVAWRSGTKNRVVVPARQTGNRFLGSLKGLQIRALIRESAEPLIERVPHMVAGEG